MIVCFANCIVSAATFDYANSNHGELEKNFTITVHNAVMPMRRFLYTEDAPLSTCDSDSLRYKQINVDMA